MLTEILKELRSCQPSYVWALCVFYNVVPQVPRSPWDCASGLAFHFYRSQLLGEVLPCYCNTVILCTSPSEDRSLRKSTGINRPYAYLARDIAVEHVVLA